MEKDNLTTLLEVNDEEYGKVTLALNKKFEEVCVIGGKIEEDPNIIYNIKLRNHLCRRKEEEQYTD